MKRQELKPSNYIEAFLNFIDQTKAEYNSAFKIVGDEDAAMQDYVHKLENAAGPDINKRGRELRNSRLRRRQNKLITQKYEEIINFFEIPANRNLLNQLRELLGKQRKKEEYVYGEKTYKMRKLKEEDLHCK